MSGLHSNPPRHEARVDCPMGDVEIRRCMDHGAKTDSNANACPRLEQCSAERRAMSNKFNPAMSNEFSCRTWPGAHLGVVNGEETPAVGDAPAPRSRLLRAREGGEAVSDDAAATICSTCDAQLLDRDHEEWCGVQVKPSPNGRHATRSVIVRVDTVERERVEWLWPRRIPRGKLTLLDGDPGEGKSTLTDDWAARVSTGSPWPDGSELDRPGAVLLVSGEDGTGDTVRPRLEAHGAALDRVYVWDHVGEGDHERPPAFPDDLALLEEHVVEVGAHLVVIDPLMAFLSAKVDSWRDQDVRGALMPLAKLADRTGAAFVVIRHLTKSGGANPLYRGGGSIGIIGAVRAAMLVARDPENPARRVLAVTKCNIAVLADSLAYRLVGDDEHGCARIAYDGRTDHRAEDLLGFPESAEERDERHAAVEFLQAVLADGGRPPKEVEKEGKAAGFSLDQLKRAKSRAGVRSRKHGFGDRGQWVWELREQPDPEGSEESGGSGAHSLSSLRPDGAPLEDSGAGGPAAHLPLDRDAEGSSPTPEGSEEGAHEECTPFAPLEETRAPFDEPVDLDHDVEVAQARADEVLRRRADAVVPPHPPEPPPPDDAFEEY